MATEKHPVKIDSRIKEQILYQIPSPILAVTKDMRVMYVNQSAIALAGKPEQEIVGKHCYEVYDTTVCQTEDCGIHKVLKTGATASSRTETMVDGEERNMEYYAVPLKDDAGEIIGGLEFIVDITKQVQYEQNLIEQSKTIQKLSTPTIKLWEGILVMPIIGVIDSIRAQNMMETMLEKIAETFARVIILDIFGVAAVDTAVAQHLIKIAKATKLMGCECILSGISPPVAQTIVQLGIDMESIHTKSTLADAFAQALRMVNLKVIHE
ncbi:MAG TPA: PAS domain-containing protein [Candidatus Limiplasma sp.]|nr:PAS domain-containing protein [Candidatus Limiplasma sp.]